MYPMYPLVSLKIPSFGLRISRVRSQGSWIRSQEAWNPVFLLLLAPGNQPIYPQPRSVSGSGMTPKSLWKVIKFQASLQGNKNHENWSQSHQKSWKIGPGIIRNPISAKVDFCNTFHAKCMFFQSQTPKFRPKNQQKKQPGNRYEKIFLLVQKCPKSPQNGSPKSSKNWQNPSLDLTGSPVSYTHLTLPTIYSV